MSDSNKNRVTSSKTPRGSQYPHRYVGHNHIVQRSPQKSQRSEITIGTVRRILELGEMLASVLTRGEIEEIQRAYNLAKSTSSSRTSNTGNIIGT